MYEALSAATLRDNSDVTQRGDNKEGDSSWWIQGLSGSMENKRPLASLFPVFFFF